MDLPVNALQRPLFEALDRGVSRFVVSAPTGSGKSTALPVMLQQKLGGQIFVLQPRRVAARMLAVSIEKLFGMRGAAGWHIRFDKHYGDDTKIVFLTEGILARMLISGGLPQGVSAIIFDEFHERNIYADLSLALALRLQRAGRDVKLLACSASVDVQALSRYMRAEVLECSSRLHEIDISYSDLAGRGLPVWDCAAKEFARRAASAQGNFLIFMPGVYEINKTVSKIREMPQARGFQVLPLHGDMPADAQDKILNPSAERKVIVATNIAETSLTIDGVDCVIDSGLAKVLRHDFSRALNTLLVENISLASAAQRAGRAGRQRRGAAVRLWTRSMERSFEEFTAPEIKRIDLSQVALWLKAGGLELSRLDLFEPPPEKAMASAEKTLSLLGAVDANGAVTAAGRQMARMPTSPRLAKLFIEASKRGCLPQAAMVAAIAEAGRIKLDLPDERAELERANMSAAASQPEEIANLCALAKANSFSKEFCGAFGIHAVNARKAFALAGEFFRLASANGKSAAAAKQEQNGLARSILAAYPDRVCARLNAGTLACRIVGGAGCEVRKASKRYAAGTFVAMSLQETNTAAGAGIIADDIVPVCAEDLSDVFPESFSERSAPRLDEHQKRACVVEETCYLDLPISKKTSYDISEADAAELLYSKIEDGSITLKNFGEPEREFIERVNFLAAAMPELQIQPIDSAALADIFKQMCMGLFSYSEVRNADVMAALRGWLSAAQLAALDYYLPKTVELSERRRPVKIRYEAATMRAVVSAYFKDLMAFNQKSLSICGGKIAPTFEILAPNRRPVQTTQDLDTFWNTSWLAIRKELKARYPKHF